MTNLKNDIKYSFKCSDLHSLMCSSIKVVTMQDVLDLKTHQKVDALYLSLSLSMRLLLITSKIYIIKKKIKFRLDEIEIIKKPSERLIFYKKNSNEMIN